MTIKTNNSPYNTHEHEHEFYTEIRYTFLIDQDFLTSGTMNCTPTNLSFR